MPDYHFVWTGGAWRGATETITPGVVEQPDIPWDMPAAYPSSAPLVFAHYFTTYPAKHSLSPDYYDRVWMSPGFVETVNGNSTDHRRYGGYMRDRPVRLPDWSSQWVFEGMKWEVEQALDAGIDGWWIDLLSRSASSFHWTNIATMYNAVEAVNAARGTNFLIALMPDGTSGSAAGSGATHDEQVTNGAYAQADLMAVYRNRSCTWKPGGRMMIPIFAPDQWGSQTRPVNAVTTAGPSNSRRLYWSKLQERLLTQYGQASDLWLCYQNTWTDWAPTFDPIAYGHGRWGDRDPVACASTSTQNRGAPGHCRSTFGKPWMHWAAPGDHRPREAGTSTAVEWYRVWENRGTGTTHESWMAAIDGQADVVQVVTWNDYPEHAHVCPSTARGWSMLDVNTYYLIRYKTGAFPPVVRDGLYLWHRPYDLDSFGPSGTAGVTAFTSEWQTKFGRQANTKAGNAGQTPLSNWVEVTAFLTSPGDVELLVGSTVLQTWTNVPAGHTRLTYPDMPASGVLSARVRRGGQVVPRTTVTGAPLQTAPVVDDLHWQGYSSLRQAAAP